MSLLKNTRMSGNKVKVDLMETEESRGSKVLLPLEIDRLRELCYFGPVYVAKHNLRTTSRAQRSSPSRFKGLDIAEFHFERRAVKDERRTNTDRRPQCRSLNKSIDHWIRTTLKFRSKEVQLQNYSASR